MSQLTKVDDVFYTYTLLWHGPVYPALQRTASLSRSQQYFFVCVSVRTSFPLNMAQSGTTRKILIE